MQVAEAINTQALFLAGQGRLDEAVSVSRRATALTPRDIDAWNVQAYILMLCGRFAEAVEAYKRALGLDPGVAELWNGLGTALERQGRQAEAEPAYGRAVALDTSHALARKNWAYSLLSLRQYERAAEMFEDALRRQPGDQTLISGLLMSRTYICDWCEREALKALAARSIREGHPLIEPFEALALFDDPFLHRHCAEAKARREAAGGGVRPKNTASGRIRVGYLSSDLHEHATAWLMAEVFERHDRNRFEIVAFSAGRITGDVMQQRLRSAFDAFHDVSELSNAALAQKIAAEGIEIAVDLKGYTSEGRTAALARRPAPVQVNFLGYPGTLGADYIDYLIADPIVVPPGDDVFYSERIVRLSDTYQPNNVRPYAAPPTRAEAGLPESGVIFSSFNNPYKITPEVFSVWMRILHAVPNSVLWLLAAHEGVEARLKREASSRSIAPERLIFAPMVDAEAHIARCGLVDIVLDTAPYGAHTTASDALWAGVPVITYAGRSFAGRVASSLVAAAGMPELSRATLEDYEAFAIHMALTPEVRLTIKKRLQASRTVSPLFDAERFTRGIEAAFAHMSAMSRRAEAPRAFDL